MRKFFFLIPAMLLSLAMSATIHEIGSSTSNILGTTVASANDGDVIILTDDENPYVNHYDADEELRDDYTRLEKNLTIQAGEGVQPIVKYDVPFRSRYGKSVKFIGITFDGSSLSHYDFYFRCYTNDDNNLEFENCEFKNCSKYIFQIYEGKKAGTLTFKNCRFHDNTNRGILNQGRIDNLNIDGCEFSNFTGNPVIDNYTNASIGKIKINNTEFYGNSQYMINGTATSHADSCIITNCYVHNNTKSFVYFRASTVANVETCDGIVIANSTFENNNFSSISYNLIDINYAGTPSTDDTQVLVDHCTFYNCPTTNSDYAAVKIVATHPMVSNSIFALPALDVKNCRAIHMQDGREVRNCLTYNYVKDSNWGIRSGVTRTNCIKEQDPLFNDLANNKYTYDGIYGVSMSPARGAATDGSDLGDPRWYTDVTYPETDFSGAGYTFTAALANAPEIEKNTHYGEDAPYLRYTGSTPTYAEATWMIKATRACNVKVTVNMANNAWEGKPDDTYQNGKHIFGVELWNSNNVRVDTVAEDTYGNGKKDGYNTYPTVELGSIEIPAAGVYTVKLLNPRAWSKCGVASVKMVYEGGAVVNIPNTIPFADAMLSARAYVDGTGLHFTDNDHLGTISNEYAKWNIHAEGGVYTFTAHCSSTNWSHLKIRVLNGNTELYTFTTEYAYNQEDKEISSPSWFLAEGDYVLELSNPANHSNGYLLSLAATSDASIFVVDENANDGKYIEDMDGVSKKVLINRTFKGGMYNTFCIPVEPGLGELESVFGTGYELLEMTSAELEDNTLNLIFTNASAVLAGKPYLIKPAEDVKNPIIPQHGIHNYTYNHTVACTNADFIGSFIAGEVPAGEDYLFLGPNNLLYFSQTATPIKGTRAYFQLKGIPHPQQVIKHARIVTGAQVITAIDLVEENTNTIKTIENGQLVIIRDGIRYNVMGNKIQ